MIFRSSAKLSRSLLLSLSSDLYISLFFISFSVCPLKLSTYFFMYVCMHQFSIYIRYLSSCLYVYLYVYVSIYLSLCRSSSTSVYLSQPVCLCVCHSSKNSSNTHSLSIRILIYLCANIYIYIYIYIFIFPFRSLSLSLFLSLSPPSFFLCFFLCVSFWGFAVVSLVHDTEECFF